LEKDGHYTDWEGRAQRLRPVRAPLGLARSEWEIFQELSEVAGADMGFHSLDALHEEMGRLLAGDAAPAEVGTAPRGQPPPSPTLRDPSPPAAEPAAKSTRTPTQGDQLILFTYPLLVDEGRLSAGADLLKSALEEQPFVEVNTVDAARLEIVDGQAVRLRTQAGEATLPARVTDGVAAGAVFVPWNQPGFAANTILSGSAVTTVTLEPAAAEVSA
jgi:predicted molibdopterin-dependent oxidoreductase YjgC